MAKQPKQAARPVQDEKAIKIVNVNRQAYHDYTVERTIEAGISLVGTEIKSIRDSKA
ncbi:MAG: SsrA-binding protein, partial [Ktedonobacteraceae bacterium]